MPWIARDRRRYDLVLRLLGFALSQSPKQIRMFPSISISGTYAAGCAAEHHCCRFHALIRVFTDGGRNELGVALLPRPPDARDASIPSPATS